MDTPESPHPRHPEDRLAELDAFLDDRWKEILAETGISPDEVVPTTQPFDYEEHVQEQAQKLPLRIRIARRTALFLIDVLIVVLPGEGHN